MYYEVRKGEICVSSILVTGGAGYVGAVLVPKLLARGHRVTVFDLFLYGDDVLAPFAGARNLRQIHGDIRDQHAVREALGGCDAVIHLACISNDPSFELDPDLGKSINYDCFASLVAESKRAGVRRFVYASSSSVYGLSEVPDVREDHPLAPLTDYSKYKALCEPILLDAQDGAFVPVILRPATVCGWSPRMRFDLSVNILTYHAVKRRKITVFGGSQTRPNIHIDDICDLYCDVLDTDESKIAGRTFNAGYQNRTVRELAEIVRGVVLDEFPLGAPITVETTPTNDLRSYRVASDRIERELGFRPRHSIEDAVRDICRAFKYDRFAADPEDDRYHNVRLMKTHGAQPSHGMATV